ncbi:MAG: universal stress protein [Burkholderiales bacterium]|nr:universal stress protein [Burkholderiales bacterium]
MNPFRSILAATDFSDDARNACRRAAHLASEHQASLELLHVISKPALALLHDLFPQSGGAETRLSADAQQALAAIVTEIAQAHGVAATIRVQVGTVVAEIQAAMARTDLLVLGSRGTSPLRDFILGTTAERLLARCTRPALVVKQATPTPYRRVLAAIDFSPYSAAVIAAATRIAPQAELQVCHAFDVPFEGKLWMAGVSDEQINNYRIQARQAALSAISALVATLPETRKRHVLPAVVRGDAARVVLDQETQSAADLIVIGKQGRSALEELLLGSVTRHVLSDSKCDVLVVNAK